MLNFICQESNRSLEVYSGVSPMPDEKPNPIGSDHDSRLEQAEIRTEQAEARTEQAKTRIEQAENRIEEAEVRIEQAETRTEQAKTRTEQAEKRSEDAETRSEQAIRASELRYRRLYETAVDGILILDADTGDVVDANPFMKNLLGYAEEEILGRKLWEIGPFKGEGASRIVFADVQRNDRVRYEGLPLETKDGRRVEVEFITTAYFVDQQRLIQCNIRDITERKKAEQQLLWKTAFFEAQVNSSMDGILVVDSDGKKILQNQKMEDLWKIPKEFADEADDSRRLQWVSEQAKDPGQFSERVAYLYAHPDKINHDEIELRNGKTFDRYTAPVRGKDGTNYGRIWAFRDVTERKRTESRFRRLVESNAQGVFFWKSQGEVVNGNDAFLKIVGYTRDDLEAGKVNWITMTPLQYLALDKKCMEELVESGIGSPFEKEFIRKDGSRVAILLGAAAFEDNPNEGVCFVVDLTERKKLEHQFLRAQRMESIGTLAGGIAHDLNNILAPIMMSIGILKGKSSDPETTSILATIEISAKRGADIVKQVLSFARGVEGERVEIHLKSLLHDFEKIIRDTFPKDILLRVSCPDDLWPMQGDPTQLHQILLNLCVNARDSMPNGGTLSIEAKNCVLSEKDASLKSGIAPGRYLNIRVSDTGTGIPPALLDKIFEPFFTTKELSKGTGLGLSTVIGIVTSHLGTINVYSEPGKGTTFSVFLPASIGIVDAPATPVNGDEIPRGNGETILVIDDETAILTITSKTLESYGYRVLTASDGANAVAVYAEHKNEVAVVLTDMAMPIMDGPATIRALMRINPAVKIIAASGLDVNDSASKMYQIGAKHFLSKPYTSNILLKAIKQVLGGE